MLAQLPLDARVVVGSDNGAALAANTTDSHEETPALADSADSQAHETTSRTSQLNPKQNPAHNAPHHDTHWPSAYQALARCNTLFLSTAMQWNNEQPLIRGALASQQVQDH